MHRLAGFGDQVGVLDPLLGPGRAAGHRPRDPQTLRCCAVVPIGTEAPGRMPGIRPAKSCSWPLCGRSTGPNGQAKEVTLARPAAPHGDRLPGLSPTGAGSSARARQPRVRSVAATAVTRAAAQAARASAGIASAATSAPQTAPQKKRRSRPAGARKTKRHTTSFERRNDRTRAVWWESRFSGRRPNQRDRLRPGRSRSNSYQA